ncbi:hypothetical protein [Gluconacetobacter takamatsuzukensis]|uniref:Uncharacterized protein n=1 Tax=Gluconacetobacter takamatsuzukensis TaxID=1286190 RepID=A0A7W4KEC6_9PROT|nr:hypothetical protein [Gluconacetobacter takamatsuzukensis]MBB2205381.1 hypothetical protein [Gluconacetobacter takamatsuzukensis]
MRILFMGSATLLFAASAVMAAPNKPFPSATESITTAFGVKVFQDRHVDHGMISVHASFAGRTESTVQRVFVDNGPTTFKFENQEAEYDVALWAESSLASIHLFACAKSKGASTCSDIPLKARDATRAVLSNPVNGHLLWLDIDEPSK